MLCTTRPCAIRLSPAILGCDTAQLDQAVALAERGEADAIHIDVMDGHFVPSITFGAPIVRDIRKRTSLPLDLHLMVEEPGPLISLFTKTGANIITVHAEACGHLYETLELIRESGPAVGVALNPGTPPCAISDVLELVDLVMVLTVNPGQSRFLPGMLKKIVSIRSMLKACGREDVPVAADGGLTIANAPSVIEAGASWLIAASAFFGQTIPADQAIRNFRQSIEQVHQETVAGRG